MQGACFAGQAAGQALHEYDDVTSRVSSLDAKSYLPNREVSMIGTTTGILSLNPTLVAKRRMQP